MPAMPSNRNEVSRWNDEAWAASWVEREPMTREVTPFLMGGLAPEEGERILDIGCPWLSGPAVRDLAVPPPPPEPGRSAPGPFTLSDAAATSRGTSPYGPTRRTVRMRRSVLIDTAQMRFFGVPEERPGEAVEAVETWLEPLVRPDGDYDAPLAFQVFTARN